MDDAAATATTTTALAVSIGVATVSRFDGVGSTIFKDSGVARGLAVSSTGVKDVGSGRYVQSDTNLAPLKAD